MYCTECGTHNVDTERECSQCGAGLLAPAAGTSPAAPIQNYLAAAILTTLCCCVPFGIVSIVFAASVNGKIVAGDVAGAREASRKARMWAWISFACGLGFWLIYMVFAIVVGAAGGFE